MLKEKKRTHFRSDAVGPVLPKRAQRPEEGEGRKDPGTGSCRVACARPTTLPGPSTPLAVPTPSPLGEPSPGGFERVSKPGFAREQESITLGPKMSLGTFGSLPYCWEHCVSNGGVSWGRMGFLSPMGNSKKQKWVAVPRVVQNS